MYHIKDDKRSKQSAELIVTGFNNMLTTQNYEEITVTAITQKAGVGRATFYRNFDYKSDILIYQIDINFNIVYDKIINTIDDGYISEQDLNNKVFDFWLNNKALINILIKAKLFSLFQNQFISFFKVKLEFVKDIMNINQHEWEYFCEIRCAMLSTALKVALENYPNDSAKDISNVLIKLFGNKNLRKRPF